MEIEIGKHKNHPTSHTMKDGKVVKWCMKCAEIFGEPVEKEPVQEEEQPEQEGESKPKKAK